MEMKGRVMPVTGIRPILYRFNEGLKKEEPGQSHREAAREMYRRANSALTAQRQIKMTNTDSNPTMPTKPKHTGGVRKDEVRRADAEQTQLRLRAAENAFAGPAPVAMLILRLNNVESFTRRI